MKSSANTNVADQDGDIINLPLIQENHRLRARVAELERLALRDSLTPLYNRRHFIDVLDRWIWRAHRYDHQGAVFFVDVDQLKTVNDQYGHDFGDQLLLAVANRLQSCVRRSDIAARIGGDEFGLLLENITIGQLESKALKISKSIAKKPVEYLGQNLDVSVSVGYAIIESGVSAAEMLRRADQSMYEAKAGKRV